MNVVGVIAGFLVGAGLGVWLGREERRHLTAQLEEAREEVVYWQARRDAAVVDNAKLWNDLVAAHEANCEQWLLGWTDREKETNP